MPDCPNSHSIHPSCGSFHISCSTSYSDLVPALELRLRNIPPSYHNHSYSSCLTAVSASRSASQKHPTQYPSRRIECRNCIGTPLSRRLPSSDYVMIRGTVEQS